RSASLTASLILLRSASSTLGSPSAASAWRATFLARSQFTGPPCQDIRSANWRRASANCCGSPSGPRAPPSSGGPPAEPEPPDPLDPPRPRPWPPGRPKPKGGSAICVASQAGWNGHANNVIPGAAPVSTAPAQVRRGRIGKGRPSGDDDRGVSAGDQFGAVPGADTAAGGERTPAGPRGAAAGQPPGLARAGPARAGPPPGGPPRP